MSQRLLLTNNVNCGRAGSREPRDGMFGGECYIQCARSQDDSLALDPSRLYRHIAPHAQISFRPLNLDFHFAAKWRNLDDDVGRAN